MVVYETYNTDAERIAAYADSLMKYNSQFAKQLNVSIESYEAIIAEVSQVGSCQSITAVPDSIRNTFVVASDINPEEHVRYHVLHDNLTCARNLFL